MSLPVTLIKVLRLQTGVIALDLPITRKMGGIKIKVRIVLSFLLGSIKFY